MKSKVGQPSSARTRRGVSKFAPWGAGGLIGLLVLMPMNQRSGVASLSSSSPKPANEITAQTTQRVAANYGKLPLTFESNQGQTASPVKFLSRGHGYSLFLTPTEAVLLLRKVEKGDGPSDRSVRDKTSASSKLSPGVPGRRPVAAARSVKSTALRMKFVGANPHPRLLPIDRQPGKVNYFVGKDPAKWRTNIATYGKVEYENLYPGVDLVYYGNQRQLEYDLVLAPGADPTSINLAFEGADKIEVDAQGDLVLHLGDQRVRQLKPLIYQQANGVKKPIAASYALKGRGQVGFALAAYDHSKPLVIDPVLVYSTYLGGDDSDMGGSEAGNGIAVDGAGSAYVTGFTFSDTFPVTPNAYKPTSDEFEIDAFVVKLDPAGSGPIYSTYLGGTGDDYGNGIAVAADGLGNFNAYITGETSSDDFPITQGAVQSSLGIGGNVDAFVVKLDETGGLSYVTYLGGSGVDSGAGIAVGPAGNAYVTGQTSSGNFPGPFQTTIASAGGYDAFVAELDPAGTSVIYSTCLGGTDDDGGTGIAIEGLYAYVTGFTHSRGDFPTTPGAYQTTLGGTGRFSDAFAAKINPDGTRVYCTYLGGSYDDSGSGIAVLSGYAYVSGTTDSADVAPTSAFPSAGNSDAFVAKVNSTGTALEYFTYLGGGDNDFGNGIGVDPLGNAYLIGSTYSTDFRTIDSLPRDRNSDPFVNSDAFVSKLNPSGTVLIYSTYLGGTDNDYGNGIAVDTSGNAYVTGQTSSDRFPGASQPGPLGEADAFVAKIGSLNQPPTVTCPPASVIAECSGSTTPVTLTVHVADPNGDTITVEWSVDGTVEAHHDVPAGFDDSFTYSYASGSHTVHVTVTDSKGESAPPCPTTTVTIVDTTAPSIVCPAPVTQSTDPGQCSAVVNYPAPTATDTCSGVTVSCTPPPGSTFPKGTTPVVCTATDASGNTATCTFTVTVVDTEKPVITCPQNIVVPADPLQCSAIVVYPAPMVSDNCPGVTFSCNPPPGSSFPKGTTTVTCTATDASGNTASCSFTVTVVDTQPPTITCPANMTTSTDPGQCSAVVNYPAPIASDNCPGVTISCSPPPGSTFPKGTTTVNCTATDASGNTASCSFTVTVVDNEPPAITCPANITRSTDPGQCSAVVNYPAPQVSDNCPGVTFSCNPPSGSSFPKGTTPVVCTATDSSGNTASCTFTVTVNDTEPPTIVCPPDITVGQTTLVGAIVNYPAPGAFDNCPGVVMTCTPPPGSLFLLGTTTVYCTATDASGNTATCSFTITVTTIPSTLNSKITGGGTVNVTNGKGSFAIVALTKSTGQPQGNLTYQDHVLGMMVKSTQVTSVVVSGTHAQVYGKATINGAGSYDFLVDLNDAGEPGTADTFQIQLSNGYTAGGTLTAGNVQVH